MIFEVNKLNDLSKVAMSEVVEQINSTDFLKELQNWLKLKNFDLARSLSETLYL